MGAKSGIYTPGKDGDFAVGNFRLCGSCQQRERVLPVLPKPRRTSTAIRLRGLRKQLPSSSAVLRPWSFGIQILWRCLASRPALEGSAAGKGRLWSSGLLCSMIDCCDFWGCGYLCPKSGWTLPKTSTMMIVLQILPGRNTYPRTPKNISAFLKPTTTKPPQKSLKIAAITQTHQNWINCWRKPFSRLSLKAPLWDQEWDSHVPMGWRQMMRGEWEQWGKTRKTLRSAW